MTSAERENGTPLPTQSVRLPLIIPPRFPHIVAISELWLSSLLDKPWHRLAHLVALSPFARPALALGSVLAMHCSFAQRSAAAGWKRAVLVLDDQRPSTVPTAA